MTVTAGGLKFLSVYLLPLDSEAPVITLTGGNMVVSCGSGFSEPGYSATDNIDGDVTGSVVVGGDTVNTSVPGTYVITCATIAATNFYETGVASTVDLTVANIDTLDAVLVQ